MDHFTTESQSLTHRGGQESGDEVTNELQQKGV